MTQDLYDKTMTKKHNMTIKGNTGGLSSCALRSWESLLRYAICLLLLMVVGVNSAWGQSEGVYYIDNNTGHSGATNARYYLIPADDPQKTDKHDAFYSSNYSMQNGDPEKPFLTVYKTNKDAASVPAGVVNNLPNNSVWILKAVSGESGYFYIIHASSGKYVIYEPPHPTKSNRKSMHLLATDSPGENAKFKFTISGSGYIINPKSVTSGNMYFNPAGSAWDKYYGNGGSDNPAYDYIGLIGLYTSGGSSVWYTESTLLVAPTISDVSASNTITITDANSLPAGYTIRYTTGDGTQDAPTATTGTEYSGAIDVTSSMTVKAVVVRYGIVLTNVASKAVSPAVESPTVTNNFDGTISLNTATPGATIYYTTNGDTPDNNSTQYVNTPFSLGNATVIKAIAYLGSVSSVVTTYNVPQYTAPTISFNSSTSQVTITSEGTVYYNTGDGSQADPTTSSTFYSALFTISSATTVKAIATHAGYLTSEVATLAITQVATPTIQNNGSNAISITSATPGATIYYTTNGDTPTISSTLYTGPLTENVSGVTIKAIAVKENMIPSAVGSGSVTLQCAAPVIVRNGSTGFTITCATTGATIYYTYVDYPGTPIDPTTSSDHISSGGTISCTLPVAVKAFATFPNYNNSNIITANVLDDLDGGGTQADPYIISSQDRVNVFIDMANTEEYASAYYKVTATTPLDFSSAASITEPFTGTFDGNNQVLTGLNHPLFNTVDGGTVKNVTLKGVAINSSADNVGAIAGTAKGYSRIYNCGILPNDATFPTGTHPTVTTTGACAGGIVGRLEDDSRVINCYSYADVNASTTAAGIVGYNTYASTASVTDGKYADLRTAVVNCMFYGNITGGSSRYPVYGGEKIVNNTETGINNYDFYRAEATVGTLADYNCSWPAKEEYLTKYEFYRNLLNSNRELCGWWVKSDVAPNTLTTSQVQDVAKDASLMAKWVLDPSIAPYPILKKFGKYASPVNIDADASWRETANEWEGKKLGTLKVTINPGDHAASGVSSTLPTDYVITDMDTLRADYCYRKIQLPYYNTVFGNPNGDTWAAKYGGNYGDYVVIGWKVSTSEGTTGTLTEDWEDGYNFADRKCTAKDANRVFAQGGYYYVPDGVNNITITAQWASAIYLDNKDRYYDCVSVSSYVTTKVDNKDVNVGSSTLMPFEPAGTRPTTLGNEKTVNNGTISSTMPSNGSVYGNAVVLVGNHQEFVGGADIGSSSKGGTVMSADFDFDEEPDHCLIWELGTKVQRQSICPVRFDFLPIVEMGLAMKEDGSTQYYSLGCYRPLGHFEMTETSLIHFGQFEFSRRGRTTYAPIILNGGIFDQYTKGHQSYAFQTEDDKIDYVIIGGNVRMPSFTPGAHVNTAAAYPTRHCAVNVIGGNIDYLYLTGNYNEGVTPNTDNPHCYIDGGRLKQVAAAGKEGIDGDVYFKINHSKIWEFYGGSTMDQSTGSNFKIVKGDIDVTIDNSIVDKYCGGPKFGDTDYANNKTIKTSATGTTFGVYYGGGNGGTSYVQLTTGKDDGERIVPYNFKISGYNPGNYVDASAGYMADYDMEIVNLSTGTNSGTAVYRSYFFGAQFSATNTGSITNDLTNCKVLTNFYGGGNLGGVKGNVTSTLDGTTHVYGSAFGAGYSATVPEVIIHNKDKVAPTIDVNTGIITPQSGGTSTTYTWTHEKGSTGSPITAATETDPKNYFYTEKSLENLGAVSGTVTLTITGDSEIGTEGDNTTGNVYGGGDASAVKNDTTPANASTTVNISGNTLVRGNVFGGGNRGEVSGSATVNIRATEPTPTP
ncbi:MAG: chitobiase/beta-hexosaminidase C-terminal domain-containing protein [Prevotella sp.]|nr:chitobiase/beta-hexosaminidase C-terminal domain-containing protein [Prevotella sp.]